jgi:hypothetical protein
MTAKSEKALVDGELVPILSDSEVYQDGDGYERVLLVHMEDNTLFRAYVRVDKAPENSFAHGDVWVPATGWHRIVAIAPHTWWKDVPGYLRWSNDRSDTATYRLLVQILEEIVKVPLG